MINSLKQRITSFGRDQSGLGTIEFVFVVPLFMFLFSLAFEFGIWQTRQTMLDHGLDRAVREVRVGKVAEPNHSDLIDMVCNFAGIIPDCDDQVRLQMFVADVDNIGTQLAGDFECRDRSEPDTEPLLEFVNTGENNQLMILRACALLDPFLPTFGIGRDIAEGNEGFYTLTASASYVLEPIN